MALETALDRLRREWHFPESFDLAQLVRGWEREVANVVAGYRDSGIEYAHRLALRDGLDEVVASLPSALAAEIGAYIEPIDLAFIGATRVVSEPVFPDPPSDRWFRIPKLLLPEAWEHWIWPVE